MIGAQRVDRDKDDRTVDGRRGARIAPSADGGQPSGQRNQNEDERVAKGAGHLSTQLIDGGFRQRRLRRQRIDGNHFS